MDIGWKIVSAGAGLVAGLAANKIVSTGWKAVTGHDTPAEDDFEIGIGELVLFAVVSGAVTQLVRQLVMRKAHSWYGAGEAAGAGIKEK